MTNNNTKRNNRPDELGKTWLDSSIEVLRESRKLATLALLGAIIFSVGWFDIDLPYFNPFLGDRRYFFVGVLVSSIALYIPTNYFINKFYEPKSDIVFEVDAKEQEDGDIKPMVRRYEIGRDKMNEMTVEGKTPKSWRNIQGKTTYLVRKIDLEQEEAETTHHAEISDIEMIQDRKKIEEGRIKVQKWATIGIELYTELETIATNAEARYWKYLTDEKLEASHINATAIKQEVVERIPELDFNEEDETPEIKEDYKADKENLKDKDIGQEEPKKEV